MPAAIDARELVEQALRDGNLYRMLLDQVAEGIYIVDCDRRILYWNGGAEQITGYFAHEVVGRVCQSDLLMHCDAAGTLLCGSGCPLKEVMADGFARECTVYLRHRYGHRIPVHIRSRPICEASGERVGAVEIFEEVRPSARADHGDLATYDCLDHSTRALKRPFGEMKARQAVDALNLFGIPFGWLRIALDGVDQLEHRYGHGVIDAAARILADTLAGNLKALDWLTCWSPAEFRIECRGYSQAELEDLVQTLAVMVSASTLEWWGDPVHLSASVVGRMAEPGDTLESLEAWLAAPVAGAGGGE